MIFADEANAGSIAAGSHQGNIHNDKFTDASNRFS